MSKKIYLIEDEPKDFNLIKEKLTEFEIIPVDYDSAFIEVRNYLKYPTEENKKSVVDYILKNEIEIIILDIQLWGNDYGGKYLYDRIISQEEKIKNTIVIYLTKTALQSQLTLDKFNAYVEKRINSRGFDVEATVARIKDEIEKLLKMRDSNYQWYSDNL